MLEVKHMFNYEPKWGPKCFVTAWSIHVPIVVLNKSQVTVYLFSLIFYRYIQCLGIMSMQEILSQHFEHYDRIWKAYKTTAKHVDVICGGNMCRFVSCYKYDGSRCGFLNLGKKLMCYLSGGTILHTINWLLSLMQLP